MRTGKGKTFRINPKNVRGVRKTKLVFLSAGAAKNTYVTPYLYICNVFYTLLGTILYNLICNIPYWV